jgi:hypothetical protein
MPVDVLTQEEKDVLRGIYRRGRAVLGVLEYSR